MQDINCLNYMDIFENSPFLICLLTAQKDIYTDLYFQHCLE